MRWQMPLGCPAAAGTDSVFDGRLAKSNVYTDTLDTDGNVTKSALDMYTEDIGIGSWRHEMPSVSGDGRPTMLHAMFCLVPMRIGC